MRLSDFWELPNLTDEQKKLRRVDVKEIVGLARDKQWFEHELKKGNNPVLCSHCNRHHYASTRCFPVNLRRKPGQHDFIALQSLGQLQLRPAPPQQNYEKLVEERKKIDEALKSMKRQQALKEEIEAAQQKYDESVRQKKEEIDKLAQPTNYSAVITLNGVDYEPLRQRSASASSFLG